MVQNTKNIQKGKHEKSTLKRPTECYLRNKRKKNRGIQLETENKEKKEEKLLLRTSKKRRSVVWLGSKKIYFKSFSKKENLKELYVKIFKKKKKIQTKQRDKALEEEEK